MEISDKTKKTLTFIRGSLLWFLIFYLGFTLLQKQFAPEDTTVETANAEVTLTPESDTVSEGTLAVWTMKGPLGKIIEICENPEFSYVRKEWAATAETGTITAVGGDSCVSCMALCENVAAVAAMDEYAPEAQYERTFTPSDMQGNAFSELGEYQLRFGSLYGEIEVVESGFLRKLFNGLIKQPLFNILVAITNALPGKSLGWGIVFLTLFVRLLLFIPNQRALRSQKEMQRLQPKLQEIQQKYKNDQQMLAAKTMEIYKTHKINPMSSCMPILLQMPFLIGIYYIAQEGISPHLESLLYGFQDHLSLANSNTNFFGLDLSLANIFPLPIIVAVAQFIALRLGLSRQKKKAAEGQSGTAGQMQQMQKIMQWAMPVMIGFFTATFPAGVGIYWLTSTVFGIFQQWIVQKQLAEPQVSVKA